MLRFKQEYGKVVLYLTSTSNHNNYYEVDFGKKVVLYLTSTSNHNFLNFQNKYLLVVLYLTSTSNHNLQVLERQLAKVVLYLTSTSNHNTAAQINFTNALCYILLLHQTTTTSYCLKILICCVISYFYIKPQPRTKHKIFLQVVLYLTSTSNHNSR